jgi:hypothetical protein
MAMTVSTDLLERILADKNARRIQARAKSWPEKIATIERLREVSKLAREGMRRAKAANSFRSEDGKVFSVTACRNGRPPSEG